jgi:hypothetical protein
MTLNDLISISEMTFKKVVLRSNDGDVDITSELEEYKQFDVKSFITYQNYELEHTLYVKLNYSTTNVYTTARQELDVQSF